MRDTINAVMQPQANSRWKKNCLITSLSPDAQKVLLARAVELDLELKANIFVECEVPKFAYFPLSGVASVVVVTPEGKTAEVGFVGAEGVTGAYHLLGPAEVPTRAFVQVEGTFLQIPFQDLRDAYRSSEEIRDRIHEFIQADSQILSQVAACNQMHELEPRLARWLLMAQDRRRSPTLRTTHEILADMIASQRSAVTTVLGRLKRQGFVTPHRGTIQIEDREGLKRAACSCYEVAHRLFSNLYRTS